MEIHCKFIAVFKQTILPLNVHDSKFEQRVLMFCKKKKKKKREMYEYFVLGYGRKYLIIC